MQESKLSYSPYCGLKFLKRRKETLGNRFSGSCSERMVRAPFERGKTGGQRLNHEDCKVKWLDYKEGGPGKRPEQSIKEGMTLGVSLSFLGMTSPRPKCDPKAAINQSHSACS